MIQLINQSNIVIGALILHSDVDVDDPDDQCETVFNTTEISEEYGSAMYVCLVVLHENRGALERKRSMWKGF